MYIEHPKLEEAYDNPQQYYFGDLMICAPIAKEGVGDDRLAWQRVWLPEGIWYNYFTGEKYVGDESYLVCSTIDETPVFVKAGHPIPIQPYTDRMTSNSLSHLGLRIFPGDNGEVYHYTLYEDDGISEHYKKEKHALTKLSSKYEDGKYQIKIHGAEGDWEGQLESRSYFVELPVMEALIMQK